MSAHSPDTADTTDTFLKQFPMFVRHDGFCLGVRRRRYEWRHPRSDDRVVLLTETHPDYSGPPGVVLWTSFAMDRHMGAPTGAYDNSRFPSFETAAAWLLLEGIITHDKYTE